ncbi:Endoplasmic reticulum-Golgi intermediate compartment protein 3 ERV46 ERGIC3 [Gracilaria domingensis]|nr:Endoplasmic reticulum-Golgi intermediate compartment protein 3 ERV46 ERGIC3 [Gracilaria domingensis]
MMTLPQRANGPEQHGLASGYARFMRSLDAFSRMMKVPEDLRTQSTVGGTISLISFVVISVLFLTELWSYLTPKRTTTLSVDAGVGETLRIYLDVDFPHVNCEVMGVDALDIGGTMQLEITNHMFKTPIDHKGRKVDGDIRTKLEAPQRQAAASPSPWPNACGSCMGAGLTGKECCNTCADVRKMYEKRGWLLTDLTNIPQCIREGIKTITPGTFDERYGCNIHGHIEISKVAGRINLTPGHSFQFHGHTLHDLSAVRDHKLDLSHRVNKLWFGEPYPGQVNPLDGVSKHATRAQDAMGAHEYFIRVVPTTYKLPFSRTLRTNQYSQSYFFRRSDASQGSQIMPGVFLNYDLSPIHVEVEESRRSFLHFLVQLCAIVGGVFTVASMLSTFMDDVVLRAVRKRQVGKLM